MEKFITFISSNFRKLYVEDIYRLLVLPKGYVIQYRYRYKYIENNLLQNVSDLIGRKSILHFGYNPQNKEYIGSIGDRCKEKVFIPIRMATIKDIYVNKEIGQVNFFLELHEFVDIRLDKNSDLSNQKFNLINVMEINVMHYSETTWLEKIEGVKDYFGKVTFFHINSLSGKHEICYDFKEKRTNLVLNDDSSYNIEFLTYDTTEGQGEINIQADESYINFNDKLEKGTEVNSKIVTLDTRSIDFRKNRTYLELSDTLSKFGIRMSLTLRKKFRRSILFGVMSSIALFSFQASNLLKDQISEGNIYYLIAAAIIITAFGVSILHWFYNKK